MVTLCGAFVTASVIGGFALNCHVASTWLASIIKAPILEILMRQRGVWKPFGSPPGIYSLIGEKKTNAKILGTDDT